MRGGKPIERRSFWMIVALSPDPLVVSAQNSSKMIIIYFRADPTGLLDIMQIYSEH